MTEIEKMAYSLVEEITSAKEGRVVPCSATIDEIKTAFHVELTEALRNLCQARVLSANLDINKKPMYKIINP